MPWIPTAAQSSMRRQAAGQAATATCRPCIEIWPRGADWESGPGTPRPVRAHKNVNVNTHSRIYMSMHKHKRRPPTQVSGLCTSHARPGSSEGVRAITRMNTGSMQKHNVKVTRHGHAKRIVERWTTTKQNTTKQKQNKTQHNTIKKKQNKTRRNRNKTNNTKQTIQYKGKT
jgi:hypothetical protein